MTLHYFRLFAFTTILLVSALSTQAQRSFGISWEMPDNSRNAIEELRQFHEMGVSIIEIKKLPDPSVWQEINRLQFEVYGHLNIQFPTTTTFAEPDSTLITSIEQKASEYLAQPSVQAIGLFDYGPIQKAEFRAAITPYVDQLQATGAQLYYVSSRPPPNMQSVAGFLIYDVRLTPENINSLSLPEDTAIGAFRYAPQEELQDYLTPLNNLLQAPIPPEKPIFLSSEWLFNILEKYPDFHATLLSLTTSSEAVFPVPSESLPKDNPSVIPILLLLLSWGIIALLYHTSPIYRKSAFRYFMAHKFFIKDIFSRQIRSPIPAWTIIILNAVLLAASVYASFITLFSSLGQEGFFYYFPLVFAAPSPVTILVMTLVLVLFLSLFSIFWLFLSHKNIRSFTQMTIIYAWPLQINFVTTTVAITLFSAQVHAYWISLFTGLSLFILLFSFILASLDAARHLRKKSSLYLVLTSGVYLIIAGITTGFILFNDTWREIADLLLNS